MSYDFLGQMFGKARRRKIEAAAAQVLTGGQKPVAVDFGVLGTRLAAGATAAVLTATLNHSLPASAGGILTVAGIGVTGALPTALKSSGLLTALSPDTLSAVQGLSRVITTALAAPAAARNAALQAAVAQEVQAALEKTGNFQSSALGKKDPDAQNGPQPGADAQNALDAQNDPKEAETVPTPTVGAPAGTPAPGADAITQTGGNQ